MLRSLLVRSQQHAVWQLLANSQIAAGSVHFNATACIQQCNYWAHKAAGKAVVSTHVCAAQQRQQQHYGSSELQHRRHTQENGTLQQQLRQYSSSTASTPSPKRQEAARSRQIQHEYRTPTLGPCLSPYTGPISWLPAACLSPWPQPGKLLQHWRKIVQGRIHHWFAEAEATNNIPGHNANVLYETVANMYLRINQAQAEFRLDPIKDLVSKDVFMKLRGQMEQRRMGEWNKIVWEMEPQDRQHLHQYIKLVQARMTKTSTHAAFTWIQFTFRIPSKQKFAAYRVRGKGKPDELVAGNPNEYIDVEDYWVLEHKTMVPGEDEKGKKVKKSFPGARWRLIERLDLSQAASKQ